MTSSPPEIAAAARAAARRLQAQRPADEHGAVTPVPGNAWTRGAVHALPGSGDSTSPHHNGAGGIQGDMPLPPAPLKRGPSLGAAAGGLQRIASRGLERARSRGLAKEDSQSLVGSHKSDEAEAATEEYAAPPAWVGAAGGGQYYSTTL